jgi:hypothetical protein
MTTFVSVVDRKVYWLFYKRNPNEMSLRELASRAVLIIGRATKQSRCFQNDSPTPVV